MSTIDDALRQGSYRHQERADLVTAVESLGNKVTTLEATLQQVLDNHIKEPEQEETIIIGGNTYYKALLVASAKISSSKFDEYHNDLPRFTILYPETSKECLVKPTKDKPNIIQGDDPRPAFKYKGKYYSHYLLKDAVRCGIPPEEFINLYPVTSENFEVAYNG